MNAALVCWKCGQSLDDLPQPLARLAECPACRADLHVCRMCAFYDTGVAKACREPVADEVNEKERANFCGYFQARPDAYRAGDDSQARQAQSELAALFGLAAEADDARSADERAKDDLNALFGLDENKNR